MVYQITQRFIPIVTLYTVASEEVPLESIVEDDSLLAQLFIRYQQKVGYDSYPIMTDSTFTAEALGCEIGFKRGEAFVIKPLRLSSAAEVEKLKLPRPENCRRLVLMMKAVKRVSRFASKENPVIANSTAPFTSAAKIIGLENVLRKVIRDPEFVLCLMSKVTDFIISFAHALIASGANIIFIADPVASTDLISPNIFRKFVAPSLRRLIDSVGCPTILHICGNIYPILRDMIKTGPTILSLDHCVNLKETRKLIGKDPLLGGNLDPGNLVFDKTPEEIAKEAWRCCLEGGPENFLLMPGCTIVPGTPIENIKAIMNVSQEALDRA